MKRFAVLAVVVGLLASLACSQVVLAKKPADKPEKVLICHVAEVIETGPGDPEGPGTLIIRRVIEVSVNAVDAHLAHGDELAGEGLAKGDDCSIFIPAGDP